MSTKAEKVSIEYMDVDGLPVAPRNPKRHDIEETKNSFRRFGCANVTAILNETTGKMVVGHGRREALIEMKTAGEPAPKRIVVKGGKWLVPVLRGVAFDTDQEAEAYLLADNRLSDIGGYDEAVLAQALADLQKVTDRLKGTGYNQDDVQRILKAADPSSVEFPEFGEDAADDVQFQECPACGHKFPK